MVSASRYERRPPPYIRGLDSTELAEAVPIAVKYIISVFVNVLVFAIQISMSVFVNMLVFAT